MGRKQTSSNRNKNVKKIIDIYINNERIEILNLLEHPGAQIGSLGNSGKERRRRLAVPWFMMNGSRCETRGIGKTWTQKLRIFRTEIHGCQTWIMGMKKTKIE